MGVVANRHFRRILLFPKAFPAARSSPPWRALLRPWAVVVLVVLLVFAPLRPCWAP